MAGPTGISSHAVIPSRLHKPSNARLQQHSAETYPQSNELQQKAVLPFHQAALFLLCQKEQAQVAVWQHAVSDTFSDNIRNQGHTHL